MIFCVLDVRHDLKGCWSHFGRNEAVTIKDGMARYTSGLVYAPGTRITDNPAICRFIGYDPEKDGVQEELISEALRISADADVIVAVLGETAGMSGESSSLTDISLQSPQRQLLESLVGTGKDVVLVLVNGRPHIPFVKFRHGYIDSPIEPLYPFGYGLSYCDVSYGNLVVGKKGSDGTFPVSVTIFNVGKYRTEETVQLYIGDPVASLTRPVKELKGFQKVSLAPNESRTVTFKVTEDDLKFYNASLQYVWEPGEFVISVGPDSSSLLSMTVTIE